MRELEAAVMVKSAVANADSEEKSAETRLAALTLSHGDSKKMAHRKRRE
jgi:hypothetical protein